MPMDVSDVMMVFPASVSSMMPDQKDIPNEYKMNRDTLAVQFINRWFFSGLKEPEFIPKEGINPEKAFRHISCILGSFEPKHEHKISACAYLLDEWFSSYKSKV